MHNYELSVHVCMKNCKYEAVLQAPPTTFMKWVPMLFWEREEALDGLPILYLVKMTRSLVVVIRVT